MNPYRNAFYSAQASWHGYKNSEDVLKMHAIRLPYYRYWSRDWLPENREARFADLACGSGQFVYFLKKSGYANVEGVDLDADQVKLAQGAGLPCVHGTIQQFLNDATANFDCISMLDVLEHLTYEELFDVLSKVSERLNPGGRLIFSVPNAESPLGFYVRHNDITHELSFTVPSLGEMLRCHKLKIHQIRDPYPAAVDLPRTIYRGIALIFRQLEALRIRASGLMPPRYWCPVIWGAAIRE